MRILRRIAYWLRLHANQTDLRDELAFHREMMERELAERGMAPGDAEYHARRAMGNEALSVEDARAVWLWPSLEALWQDCRDALRGLRRHPTFTLTVVLTLALGIGANTALFSVVRRVLLDPLPYTRADELVVVGSSPWNRAELAMAFREMRNVFRDVAGYYPEPVTVTNADAPYQVQASRITPNFLPLLGSPIARGRDFTDADAEPGAEPTAIISSALWMSRYAGRPDVIGLVIQVNDRPHRIIGVTDDGFHLLGPRADDPQVLTPMRLAALDGDGRPLWVIPVMRMSPGVSIRQGQGAVDRMIPSLTAAHPELGRDARWIVRLATIKSEIVKDVRMALIVLQLTAAMLLLIACVNVANLLLARADTRQSELAVRSALGASRMRLVGQFLTESMALSLLGGIAGVLLMRLTIDLLLGAAPANVPRIGEVRVDASAFGVAIGIAVVTGLLCAVIPAAVTFRGSFHQHLKEGGRGPSRSSRQRRISQALVVAEVTLTLVLLSGAGLLVQTFRRLSDQELGFRTDHVLTMRMQIPGTRYHSVQELDAFYSEALSRLSQTPRVQRVAVANNLPISRANAARQFEIEGDGGGSVSARVAEYGVVSPDYLRVLDIPLLRGRFFDGGDRRGTTKVAIIDATMAQQAFPGRDPLGRRFRFDERDDAWLTVVGVVGNIRGDGLAKGTGAGFYIPYTQRPATTTEMAVGRISVFLIRSTTSAGELAAPLREAIWSVNAQQPVLAPVPLADAVAQGAAPHRFRAILLGTFAGIALVLVAVGVYGVIQYAVAERRREFGVRLALGATPRAIMADVLWWGLRLFCLGAALGLIGACALSRLLRNMLSV